MSRSERLLDLIQILRRHRRPVSGRTLADEMSVSIRTLYRDIATLQGQGAPIEGEAGLGYVLKPGFMLPPLMFSDEEIEAIVLGSRWVAKQPDRRLSARPPTRWPRLRPCCRMIYARISMPRPCWSGRRRKPWRASISARYGRPSATNENSVLSIAMPGCCFATRRLAVRARLLRQGTGDGGVVRDAAGFPAFSYRSYIRPQRHRCALSASPPGAAQGMAGDARQAAWVMRATARI